MALDLTLAGNGKRSRGMLVPVKGLPIARLKVQEHGMMAVVRRTCSAMMTRGKYGVRSMRWTIMLEAGDVAAAVSVLSCMVADRQNQLDSLHSLGLEFIYHACLNL